jgi:hypothetical protein
MLPWMLNLAGCSEEGTRGNKNVSKDSLGEQIKNSLEAYKNRPVYKTLTAQAIDTIPDDDLVNAVFDHLSEKLPADVAREYEAVMKWNKSRQAIYMIWQLEAEVNNGGFNQFYYNSSGQYYKYLPAALTLVGAKQYAGLVREANNIFEKENAKITKDQDGSVEGFSKSYEDNPLNKYDDQFYGLYKTENLRQIQIAFIRGHKLDFTDK